MILVFCNFSINAQTFIEKFKELYDYTISPRDNKNFKEFYEIIIPQPIDHEHPKKTFDHRIYIGFQGFDSPNVIETDGYAIDHVGILYTSGQRYTHELSTELKANLIVVEHRYFGKF
ncbi:MAG: ptp [Bacteroidetes bacterium]|nr:ptp [Bacteroidota bacterium]